MVWVAIRAPDHGAVRPTLPRHQAASAPAAVQGQSAAVLRRASGGDVGLAIWHRPPRPSLRNAVARLSAGPAFSKISQGAPAAAARALVRDLPFAATPLGVDIAGLAALFAGVTGEDEVRLRLEHVVDDACRCHHVDAVRLRLLCTYAGIGTEWLDRGGRTHRMPVMHVGIFKGSAYPDDAPRVLHRSPPVSRLPQRQRSRILLCIDQTGVF